MTADVLNSISFGIGLIGVVVIIWGSLITLREFFSLEIKSLKGLSTWPRRMKMRQHYGSYILLGLEFLIAADIMHTLMQPELEELAALGAIVAIRTTLSYFLNREMESTAFTETEQ